MINENTWHRNVDQQTNFVWDAVESGIELYHSSPSYVIPWVTLFAVYAQARLMASQNNNVVTAGTSMTNPTPGSVGAWVLTQNLPISTGSLTPRHLSFLGPVLHRMGFVNRQLNGNSIQWIVN